MNSFRVSSIQKNKLIAFIFLLLVSIMSVYMPHGLVERYEHHDYEISFKHIINNKPETKLKKLLKKLRSFILKIVRAPEILSKIVDLADIRLVLFNLCLMRFLKVSILHLLLFLCSYFHGSKFKHSINHSDLLPLMAV